MIYTRPQKYTDAPKTLRESLERAVAFLETDLQADSCKYRTRKSGKTTYCIIGSYFTDLHLDVLDSQLKLGSGLTKITDVFVDAFDQNVVSNMTKMTKEQAVQLQKLFNDKVERQLLSKKIQAVLLGVTDYIDGTEFKI